MVAILSASRSIRQCFFYNENKVSAGQASCLLAENYHKNLSNLSASDRLLMLSKLSTLSKAKVNCLHISLNFDPKERLSPSVLQEIAKVYMQGIGFANQPYLVYEHRDAAHPHIHIVTTNIQADGSRIDLHLLANRKSEPVRKSIENTFGLVRAADQKPVDLLLKKALPQVAEYGKSQMRRAIANVLAVVLKDYAFSSLPELNTILNQYNIIAERGGEDSRIFKHKGLVYRLLDQNGRVIGVPIKASIIPGNPGLSFLEKHFLQNLIRKEKCKVALRNTIDKVMNYQMNSLEEVIFKLASLGVHMVVKKNKEGFAYGVSFVDHNQKCVFNGSALGRAYSLNSIEMRLNFASKESSLSNNVAIKRDDKSNRTHSSSIWAEPNGQLNETSLELLNALTEVEKTYDGLPFSLRVGRKTKRRSRLKKL